MARAETDAAVIGVSAAVVYDVISATNSSPQTTEINAAARATTLMKWVHIGLVQALLFIGIMTIAEPRGSKWRPMTGGGLAALLLYIQYLHARASGLRSSAPPTEHYETQPGAGYGTMEPQRRVRQQRPARYETKGLNWKKVGHVSGARFIAPDTENVERMQREGLDRPKTENVERLKRERLGH